MDIRKIIEQGRGAAVPFLRPDELVGLMTNITATGVAINGRTRCQTLAGIPMIIRSVDTLAFDEYNSKRIRNTYLYPEHQAWRITYRSYDFTDPRRSLPMDEVEDVARFSGDVEQFKKDMSLVRLFDAIETLDWSNLQRPPEV